MSQPREMFAFDQTSAYVYLSKYPPSDQYSRSPPPPARDILLLQAHKCASEAREAIKLELQGDCQKESSA